MRTQIYEHRSGLKVVPCDIVSDVEKILWDTHRSKSIHIRLRASGISCNISRVECRANEQSICVPPMVLIQQQKNACCYFTGRATALHPH